MKKKNTSGNGDGLSYEEEQLPYSDAGENEDEQEYYDDEKGIQTSPGFMPIQFA